ncbi:MAG: hypothetical protein ACPG5B_09840 [Chitinophagales bacterium]
MCQFNLLIIDNKSKAENLKDLFFKNGFGYNELDNKNLQSQIGRTKKIILTTKNECDCGSVIGLNQHDSNANIDIEKKRKKLRKKKWSAVKIERYLSDILKEQKKVMATAELKKEAEENNWIRIAEGLINRKVQFGILYHHFSGLLEDETIEIEKINQIPMTFLSKGKLRDFKENQLNWITR